MSKVDLLNYEYLDENIDNLEKSIKELQNMSYILDVLEDYNNDISEAKEVLKEYKTDVNGLKKVISDKEKELEDMEERIKEIKDMIKKLDNKKEGYQEERRKLNLDREQLIKREKELKKDLKKCRYTLIILEKSFSKSEEEIVKEILFSKLEDERIKYLLEDIASRGKGKIKEYINNIIYNLKENSKGKYNEIIFKEVCILESEVNERFKVLDDDNKVQINKVILNQLDNIFMLSRARMRYYNLEQIKELENFDYKDKNWYIKRINDKFEKVHKNINLGEFTIGQIKDILVAVKIEESKKYDKYEYKDGVNQKKYTIKDDVADIIAPMEIIKWSFDIKNKYINNRMKEKKAKLDLERMKKEIKNDRVEKKAKSDKLTNSIKNLNILKSENFNDLKNHTYMLHTVFSVEDYQRNKLLKDNRVKKAYEYVEKMIEKEEEVEKIFEIYNPKKLCQDYESKSEQEKIKILESLDNYYEILDSVINYASNRLIKIEHIMNKESVEKLQNEQTILKKYLQDKLKEVKDVKLWLQDKLVSERKLQSGVIKKLKDSIFKLNFIIDYNIDIVNKTEDQELKELIDEAAEILNSDKSEKIKRFNSDSTLFSEETEFKTISRFNSESTLVEEELKNDSRKNSQSMTDKIKKNINRSINTINENKDMINKEINISIDDIPHKKDKLKKNAKGIEIKEI